MRCCLYNAIVVLLWYVVAECRIPSRNRVAAALRIHVGIRAIFGCPRRGPGEAYTTPRDGRSAPVIDRRANGILGVRRRCAHQKKTRNVVWSLYCRVDNWRAHNSDRIRRTRADAAGCARAHARALNAFRETFRKRLRGEYWNKISRTPYCACRRRDFPRKSPDDTGRAGKRPNTRDDSALVRVPYYVADTILNG